MLFSVYYSDIYLGCDSTCKCFNGSLWLIVVGSILSNSNPTPFPIHRRGGHEYDYDNDDDDEEDGAKSEPSRRPLQPVELQRSQQILVV